jgi:hypothetical protein
MSSAAKAFERTTGCKTPVAGVSLQFGMYLTDDGETRHYVGFIARMRGRRFYRGIPAYGLAGAWQRVVRWLLEGEGEFDEKTLRALVRRQPSEQWCMDVYRAWCREHSERPTQDTFARRGDA